jgi:predicted  nucleic acid-binding Zn-ribbon protein
MSAETKAKIAAARAANKAAGTTGEKRASLEDQLAAIQAAAEGGDAFANSMLPVLDTLREEAKQAKVDFKSSMKKLRKTLNLFK